MVSLVGRKTDVHDAACAAELVRGLGKILGGGFFKSRCDRTF